MQQRNERRPERRLCAYLCLVLVFVFSLCLTGCASENIYLNDAANYYKEGKYADAETSFLKAIRNGETSLTVYSGYAFNQLKAGDTEGAKALFELMINQNNTYGDYFDREPETGEAVRKGLLQIYMSQNDLENAVVMYKELGDAAVDKQKSAEYKKAAALLAWKISGYNEKAKDDGADVKPVYDTEKMLAFITTAIEAGNEDEQLYRMSADLHWMNKEWDLWEADMRKIIDLKEYAIDEYNCIYGMRLEEKTPAEVLALVDEAVVYLNGHSAYIDDYSDIIPMVLKAAEFAERVEWEKKSSDYFDTAEKYITDAENNGYSDNEILKFKIIVAEKKGKMNLAYKLLGVYLEHCPDDRMAYKEQKYLENRIGITAE